MRKKVWEGRKELRTALLPRESVWPSWRGAREMYVALCCGCGEERRTKKKERFAAPEVVLELQIEAGVTWVIACCLTGVLHI